MSEGKPHIDAMDQEEARRVARLIAGFIRGELSRTEWDDLDDWIAASDKNMQLFEQLTDEDHLSESVEWLLQVGGQTIIRQKKDSQTAYPRLQSPIGKLWIYGAAAVMLIIFGAVYYKYAILPGKRNITVPEWPANVDTEPGNKAPVLIFRDGKRAPLSISADSSLLVAPNVYAHIGERVLNYPEEANGLANDDWNILQTPAGNDYGLRLSDGSSVRLNTASAIRYPVAFNHTERIVELRGEAYFEVQEDPARPFLVKCGNTTIRVTGTRFNINAYPGENKHSVVLLEGSVEIQRLSEQVRLLPNQQAILIDSALPGSPAQESPGKIIFAGKEIMVRDHAGAEEDIAWTKGLFSFHKAAIEEVMQQAAKWYGITVRYNGKTNQEFSGNIPRSSTLEEFLQMLQLSGEIRFAINGKQVVVQP